MTLCSQIFHSTSQTGRLFSMNAQDSLKLGIKRKHRPFLAANTPAAKPLLTGRSGDKISPLQPTLRYIYVHYSALFFIPLYHSHQNPGTIVYDQELWSLAIGHLSFTLTAVNYEALQLHGRLSQITRWSKAKESGNSLSLMCNIVATVEFTKESILCW